MWKTSLGIFSDVKFRNVEHIMWAKEILERKNTKKAELITQIGETFLRGNERNAENIFFRKK